MKIRLFTIPNLLTLANLACGSAAAVYALRYDDMTMAFWLVAAAAVFDFLDGFAARLTGQYSEVGKQLDSLCDMVSFGVVPAAVLFSIYNSVGGPAPWGWIVFVVALFSALRLAKFNVDDSQSDSFTGLPTPACALLVTSAGWLFAGGAFTIAPEYVIAAAIVLSCLLICPLRMFALKFHGFSFGGNEVRYCFLALSAIGLAVFHIAALPFIIAVYILVSLVNAIR